MNIFATKRPKHSTNSWPYDFETWVVKVRDPAIRCSEGLRVINAGECMTSYEIATLEMGVAISWDFRVPNGGTGTPWLWFPNRDEALEHFKDSGIRFFEREKSGFGQKGCEPMIANLREFRNLFGFDEPEPKPGFYMTMTGRILPKKEAQS